MNGRKSRKLHGFPLRPVWAEWFVGGLICGVILGATAMVNAYIWPPGNIKKYFESLGQEVPECAMHGGTIYTDVCATFGHGFAYPVLILIVGRHRHDHPDDPHPVWPLCLCHRRQPRGCGPVGHQHPR